MKIKISKVEYIQILLEEVLYVPEIKINLFSLSDVTKRKDVKVNIEGDKVIIGGPVWGPWSLFIRSKNETLYHMDCERVVSIDAACAFIENEKLDSSVKEKIARKATEINIFHQRLGHPSEASTIKTAELNRIKLKGKFKTCESCIYGKAHQNPVKKWTGTRATVPYERVFVDITSLQHTSLGGSKHWAVVVDDATRFRWSFFMKDKSCLSNIMTTYPTTVRQQGHSIKFIRCDNAGENLGLKRIRNENGIKL